MIRPTLAQIFTFSIAALSIAVVVAVLCYRVDLSGTWDGDPSIHLKHAQATTNVIAEELASGGHASKGYLQSFAMYPKVAHEWMLGSFLLLFHGFEPIDFRQAELGAAWFATLWSLLGVAALFFFIKRMVGFPALVISFPVVALSGYVLLYANYPRHNMAAHALCWLASLVYLRFRVSQDHLAVRPAIYCGILFAIAVPTHYTSMYWLFGLGMAELLLIFRDRRFKETFRALSIIGALAIAVWLLIDAYYYLFIYLFPEETNWTGELISASRHSRSITEGLLDVLNNLWGRKASHKIDPPVLWFYPAFLYRNFGVAGSALMALGLACLLFRAQRHFKSKENESDRTTLILLGFVAGSTIAGLEYFQNARKLAVFYPLWAALIAMGVQSLCRPVAGGSVQRKRLLPVAVFAAGLSVWGLQWLTYYDQAKDLVQARRDVGKMREFLQANEITRVLSLHAYVEAQLAPEQQALREWPVIKRLTMAQTQDYEYLLTHRLWPGQFGEEFLDCLRSIEPVTAYPNQITLPMFWYEFPLSEKFWDINDPLLNTRRLYKWKAVRSACGDELMGRYITTQ